MIDHIIEFSIFLEMKRLKPSKLEAALGLHSGSTLLSGPQDTYPLLQPSKGRLSFNQPQTMKVTPVPGQFWSRPSNRRALHWVPSNV